MNTNKFQRFDYGSIEENLAAYGQADPPQYNPADIRLKKMILVRSKGNDFLSQSLGQEQFISTLTGKSELNSAQPVL